MSDTSRTPGEYTDEETPDGRDTRESSGHASGIEHGEAAHGPETEGEYTDTDFDGDR